MSKTIPEISIESQLLFDRLCKLDVGESITYDDLSKMIGRNVQKEAYGMLYTARNKVLNEKQYVIEPVKGEGVKRLGDTEMIPVGMRHLRESRRKAKRGARKLASVQDFAALPNETKITHNTIMSMLGAISSITKPSSLKKIEAVVQQSQEKLPLAKMIEAMNL